jgi:rSAM/selenodomain-associated transferase 1
MPDNKKTNKNDGILFFVKYPIKGYVKSRLNSKLSSEKIISIYRNFVEDLHVTLTKTDLSIVICYDPSNYKTQFQQWLGQNDLYYPQKGKNLGQRMSHAFHQGFQQGFTKLLVLGSDSPDLTTHMINKASNHLDNNDVVIGPSNDGGYYLFGLKRSTFHPEFFYNIKWSTSTVFTDTLKLLQKHRLKIKILPEWYDIDTYDDLYKLYERNLDTSFNQSNTMKELRQYFK